MISSWKLDGPRFVLDVTVPPNTTANVLLHGTTAQAVRGVEGARDVQQRDRDLLIVVGSGNYQFTVRPLR